MWYEKTIKKIYDDSDSDDDYFPPTTVITNVDPPIPINDPNYPRSPWPAVQDILTDVAIEALCTSLCTGTLPVACFALFPQCANATNLTPQWPSWYMAIRRPFLPREVLPNTTPKVIRIYWLITDKIGRFNNPNTNSNGERYDFHYKSTVGTLFPSIKFIQDKAGSWLIPNQTAGWGTTTPSIDSAKQTITLTDDHTSRIDDAVWYYQWEWRSTGGQRIIYHLTKQYDPINYTPVFKTITLPSDVMYFNDKQNHAPTTPLIGALGGWHNGATEAFWDSNRAPKDETITIDLRDIPVWSPTNHTNVEAMIPCFGNAQNAVNTCSVTLTNNTDQALSFFLGRVGVGTVGNSGFVPIGVTVTITANWTEAYGSEKYKRNNVSISYFSPIPAVGFISLESVTTRLPQEITRKEYTPKDVIVKAYLLDPLTSTLTNVPLESIYESELSETFESSAFGNRDGYKNKYIILECLLWLHNWPHFGGGGVLSTTPAVNLAIDGSVRIANTLTDLQNQLTGPGASKSYANPYDDDAAKNGVVTVGNNGIGAPSLIVNQQIQWFLSRDLTYDNTLRWSRVVTLN